MLASCEDMSPRERHGAEAVPDSGERGHMRRNRPKPHVTFQARISPEAEKLRRRLQQQSGESNGTLVERAFRKLDACPDEAPEQLPEAAV